MSANGTLSQRCSRTDTSALVDYIVGCGRTNNDKFFFFFLVFYFCSKSSGMNFNGLSTVSNSEMTGSVNTDSFMYNYNLIETKSETYAKVNMYIQRQRISPQLTDQLVNPCN